MKNKTIVHVITNFNGIGGAEMMLERLIEETKFQYDHVIISLIKISSSYQKALSICKFHYCLNWNGINTLKTLLNLKKLLSNINPDIVQCWMYHANIFTSLSVMGMKRKPPVIWGVHHSLTSVKEESKSTKIALLFSKYLAQQPSAVIYCAHSSLSQHESFGFKGTNNYVIANGVSLNRFLPNSTIHTPITIGFAGRYHIAKGYSYLFETISLLKDYPITFKIAGKGADFNNSEIQEYFKKYSLDKSKVLLLGHITNMSKFYRSIDIFLMTSITEGFPNVLVEAMASGVPCITTDVGDAGYIVDDIGYVVPTRDVTSMKNSILDYYNSSASNKLALKKSARDRVELKFSIEKISQDYTSIWENFLFAKV